LFSHLRWNHSKGNLLTLKIPELPHSEILHHGKWILPIGNQCFKAGSTFQSYYTTESPDQDAKAEILEALQTWIKAPFTLQAHQAGIRPISIDNKPILGKHPIQPQHVLFNALGSRGLTLAPYFAQALLTHLNEDTPLDPEVDINRKALRPKMEVQTKTTPPA
jgi:glycine/D-amino acid oxidase-like deaminating enzyme